MSDLERLKQKLAELQKRWNTLHEKHQAIEKQYDLETDAARKHAQEKQLEDINQKLTEIEAEITTHRQQIQTTENHEKLQDLNQQLATLRANKAYQEALDVARQIQTLLPNDPKIEAQLEELQERYDQGKQAQAIFAQLTAHFAELSPIINELAHILNPRHGNANMHTVAQMAQNYLDKQLTAEAFISLCQTLLSPETRTTPDKADVHYSRVAESIRNGRTVLFLGSAIPYLYSGQCDDEDMLAARLAEEIQYQNFTGSLSSIAEYYHLAPGFGQGSLLESLDKSLDQKLPASNLYQSLAQTTSPLVLISAAYDSLLERAFRQANKPFVEIASIIMPNGDYKLGKVVLRYSDKDEEEICSKEDLSRKQLLPHYSIIYKIRGTCDQHYTNGNLAWKSSLTLSESNYFTFAENAQKIIPDYLTSQFHDRGFLFIGFTPSRWEDRLLARALLAKRSSHLEPCYTIGKTDDLLQAAFWKKQEVQQSEMEFAELDKHLREAVQ